MNAIAFPCLPGKHPTRPYDEPCARGYFSAILNANDDPALEPGDLGGLSRILANARRVLGEVQVESPAS